MCFYHWKHLSSPLCWFEFRKNKGPGTPAIQEGRTDRPQSRVGPRHFNCENILNIVFQWEKCLSLKIFCHKVCGVKLLLIVNSYRWKTSRVTPSILCVRLEWDTTCQGIKGLSKPWLLFSRLTTWRTIKIELHRIKKNRNDKRS